jgi:hypothetical protein
LILLFFAVLAISFITYKIRLAIKEHKLSKRIGGMTWPRPIQW